MVTHQELIGGDHSNNGRLKSRAVAVSEGSIYFKSLRWTLGILLFLMHDVDTGFWKMYQITPPAWWAHLGNGLFEVGNEQRIALTTGKGLK